MTTSALIFMAAQGVIFVLWAFFMFRMLWRMSRRSLDRLDDTGGGYFTWVGHSLNSFFSFFRDDATRADRRRLLVLTVLMIGMIAAGPVLLSPG